MALTKARERLSLYELGEEVQALEDLVAMDEGEWTPQHEELEREVISKLAVKADAFGGYVRSLEATAAACKEEEQRLAARRKACEARVARLKLVGMTALQAMHKTQVKGELFTLALQANPASVDVSVPVDQLPEQYVRVQPEERHADKRAILDALQQGIAVVGCTLTRTQSLRIR